MIFILALIAGIVVVFNNYESIKNTILKKFYIRAYEDYVIDYSKKYDVDPNLVYAIIKSESNFKKEAISNKDAKGLMQIMYPTAVDVAKVLNINIDEQKILDPEINIMLGTKYISMLISKYNDLSLALAAYNAGSGNVDKWIEDGIIKSNGEDIENIPFKETNNYVRKILRDYKIYNQIYAE